MKPIKATGNTGRTMRKTLGLPPAKESIFLPALVGIVWLAYALPGLAQTPPDAGSLLRQQEQQQQRLPQRLPQTEPPEIVPPALAEVAGVKVRIQSVWFGGALDLASEADLQALVQSAIGQQLDMTGLQALADKVTDFLRSRGHLLARAYMPRQDVTEGKIEIFILKGRLDGSAAAGGGWKINLSKDARIATTALNALADTAAPSGSSLMQDDLERALLLMNDLPGIKVRSRLQPGVASGSSQLHVDVSEGPLFGGMVWLDNYGSRNTGKAQANALLNINDPLGTGDHLGLLATTSEGIQLARLGYDLPIGASGLRARLGYAQMRYQIVDGVDVAAALEGRSKILNAGFSYPIIRSRTTNLNVALGADHKRLNDDSAAGALRAKQIDVVSLHISGSRQDGALGGGFTSGSVDLASGRLDLSGVAADQAADAASLQAQGSYQKLGFQLNRLQILDTNWTLLGRVSGQWASKNLDSSEKFILGGTAGVRAYPASEGNGDEGWLASLELRYDLPGVSAWGELQFSAFVDSGSVSLHKTPGSEAIATASGKNKYSLSGAGLGITLSRPASHSLRLLWATPVSSNPGRSLVDLNGEGQRDTSRFWLQAIFWF